MSTLQHFGKGALRVAKNYTKGYSNTQAKVRDATSNDPWGPSGTQMNEIAQLTFNQQDFVEIMEMLDKRLNDKGKNWRHVWKALTVLDYCLHEGSENVIIYFKDNMYLIKTLKEFVYIDEYDKDQGANVRQRAKDITNLLMDESRLREERRTRSHMRNRMVGQAYGYDEPDEESPRERTRSQPSVSHRSRPAGGDDDDELKRAIEASKRSLQEERDRQGNMTAEERDLAAALKLSEEEEAARVRALDDSNSRALFDEGTQLNGSSSNPFPLIDPSYNQLQPQMTLQPQFTSFNPYAAQLQAQQQAMQDEWNRQQVEYMLQQQQAQAQQAQAQAQEEWMRQQQQQAMQGEWMRQQALQQQQQQQFQLQSPAPSLQAQPTGYGSNNPFAPSSLTSIPPMPSISPSSFSSVSSPPISSPSRTNSTTPSSSTPTNPIRVRTDDGQNAHLASLFANRDDGLDSFGNIGNLRFGHHYAAPLVAAKTGSSSNPFTHQGGQQQQNEQPFFSI